MFVTCFSLSDIAILNETPTLVMKAKDQDFIVGKDIHYQFSPERSFPFKKTTIGVFALAALAAEIRSIWIKPYFKKPLALLRD